MHPLIRWQQNCVCLFWQIIVQVSRIVFINIMLNSTIVLPIIHTILSIEMVLIFFIFIVVHIFLNII